MAAGLQLIFIVRYQYCEPTEECDTASNAENNRRECLPLDKLKKSIIMSMIKVLHNHNINMDAAAAAGPQDLMTIE